MTMKAEQGILLPAMLTPVGEGVTGAQYAIVNIGGLSHRCVVKQVGDREIAAECFCALLGHHLGLPTLVPIVITDPRDQSFWFGARDIGYPSLSTRFSIKNSASDAQFAALASILSAWSQVGHTISFDELIANGDRNPGNVLWNGVAFTIIDHERALGLEPMEWNKLAIFSTQHLTQQQVASIQCASTSAAFAQQALLGLESMVWEALEAEFVKLPNLVLVHFKVFRTFAQERMPSLVNSAANALTPLFHGIPK